MRRRAAASFALAAVLVAACSSTKADNSALNLRAGTSAEAGVGESGTTPGGDTTSAADGGVVSAGGPSTAATGGVAGTGSAGTGTAAGSSPAAPAAPTSSEPIVVGAYGLKTAGGAVGIDGAALGDPDAFAAATVKWVNAHGGVAGHPIRLVTANTDPTSSTPLEQQDQAACAKFTEDNKAKVVISIVVTTPAFDDCMAKRGVLYIANSIVQPDSSFIMSAGNRFSVSPASDRVAVTLARELVRNGYTKDAGIKLGMATEAHPWFQRAGAAFKAELARAGGPPIVEEFFGCSGCSSDQAKVEAQNAVLRFRAAGVTHLVLPDGSTGGTNFLLQANSSGYFPRLAITSSNTPTLLVLDAPNPQGYRGAVGIGWMPVLDTDGNPSHGAPPPSEREKLCDQIMAAQPGATRNNRLAEEQAQFTCDGFFLLKETSDRLGKVDLGSFRTGLEGLGESFRPFLTFSAFFGPGRRDGAQSYRPLRFDDGCACFAYAGNPLPFVPLPGHPR